MYDESLLITHIASATGFIVDYAEDSTIDTIDPNSVTTPRVYIGHIGIKPQSAQDTAINMYNGLENPSVLYTTIQFICERSSLVATRTAIAEAYAGFTPFVADSDYSSLFFVEGNMIVKTGTKVWWQEVVGLVFPRIS